MGIFPASSGKIFGGSTKGFKIVGVNFNSFAEMDSYIKDITRKAYQATLDNMANKLRQIIKEDVYNNAYTTSTAKYKNDENYKFESQWGGRTETLLERESVETYIYNAFGKGIAGGIRFNDQPYYQNMNLNKFIHGNKYWGQLAFKSYLEILNNSMLLPDNPYGFPTFRDIHRDSFWYDFTKWANENFERIFSYHINRLIGSKVVASSYLNLDSNNNKSSMNLSQSTSNVRSLDTRSYTETSRTGFSGTVSLEDESGNTISSTTYN